MQSFTINERGCWVWQLSCSPGNGKAQCKFEGKMRSAAHVSFYLRHGRWPDVQAGKRCLMHTCEAPGYEHKRCVNPDHLVEGTWSQNMKDAFARGLIDMEKFRKARSETRLAYFRRLRGEE